MAKIEGKVVPMFGESPNDDFEDIFSTLDDWEAILKGYRADLEALGGDE